MPDFDLESMTIFTEVYRSFVNFMQTDVSIVP
jgi:hypothetical protein